MIGLLLYKKEDYLRNQSYVEWLIDEGQKKDINLKLIFKEDLELEGIGKNSHIDFVINRTRSYEVSLLFELNDIRVFNNSEITLLGNNKLAAYSYAKSKGFTYPGVLLNWDGGEIISKPNDSHGGQGIGLIGQVDLGDGKTRFQQRFLRNIVGDIRFYVIDNKIIHAVLRKAGGKILSNFSQGGEIDYYKFSAQEKSLVEKFMKGLQIDYVGLDFFLTDKKELIFNEIEDVVGSRMLSTLGINNTTELYFEHIAKQMKK
ncbi:MAG: hypothetical protein WCZ27_08690 [Tissierellaceae bacterium]